MAGESFVYDTEALQALRTFRFDPTKSVSDDARAFVEVVRLARRDLEAKPKSRDLRTPESVLSFRVRPGFVIRSILNYGWSLHKNGQQLDKMEWYTTLQDPSSLASALEAWCEPSVVHDEQCDEERTREDSHLPTIEGRACFCGTDAATAPEQLMSQLSWARAQYQERVDKLCSAAGRDIVYRALALFPEQDPIEPPSHEKEKRFQLALWLARDEHAEAARKVIAEGGAYCVFHGGDMRRCPPGSHT